MPTASNLDFLQQTAPEVAQKLLGWQFFVREADGSLTGGVIAETEAYTADDEASHSYRGKTARNGAMFEPAGTVYVYFTYGMHWCLNIVTGKAEDGEAVLIRSLLPTYGTEMMQQRRGISGPAGLSDGPAKLCQALGVQGLDNGKFINDDRFVLSPPEERFRKVEITVTPRIGIQKGRDKMWRFVLG